MYANVSNLQSRFQIPNPLFDLAGITCGHFLIPFWTFFGATLLGKAVVKMMIQVLFVIIAFNETLIETALQYVSYVPVVGKHLQAPFNQFLENQKKKLHAKEGTVPNVSFLFLWKGDIAFQFQRYMLFPFSEF